MPPDSLYQVTDTAGLPDSLSTIADTFRLADSILPALAAHAKTIAVESSNKETTSSYSWMILAGALAIPLLPFLIKFFRIRYIQKKANRLYADKQFSFDNIL